MVNTMADLRREVAVRLRNSLHGREIDMMESVKPTLPHMLGITPVGKEHDPDNEEMTLLDTRHEFWQDYVEEVLSERTAKEKIETAVRSLKEEGTFRMTYPYGEEAEVVYVEVDDVVSEETPLSADCAECGSVTTAVPRLTNKGSTYALRVSVSCDECGFSATYDANMVRI